VYVRKDEYFVLTKLSWTMLGATTEVAALKKALAKAEDKAAKEHDVHVKHEPGSARCSKSFRMPLRSTSPWSVILRHRRPNLPRLARAHKRLEPKPRVLFRNSRRLRRLRRVSFLLCKAS